jgi:hypothetical protein
MVMSKGKLSMEEETTGGMWSRLSLTVRMTASITSSVEDWSRARRSERGAVELRGDNTHQQLSMSCGVERQQHTSTVTHELWS